MFTINKSAFERAIRAAEETKGTDCNVKGMDETKVQLMIRLLSARNPSEIEDVSDDDIVSMFDHIGSFADCMGSTTIFDNIGYGEGNLVRSLATLPSAKRRRVL